METTPDTFGYMILGYSAFAIITVTYLVSLFIRWRKLKREIDTLDEIAKK